MREIIPITCNQDTVNGCTNNVICLYEIIEHLTGVKRKNIYIRTQARA